MAVVASSGNITVGTCIAMGGLMIAQFEETESDIKMTADEGSWFGKKTIIKTYFNLSDIYYLIRHKLPVT